MKAPLTTLLFAAVLLSAFGLSGCGENAKHETGSAADLPVVPVRIQSIERTPQTITEAVVGTVRARLEATLEANVRGRIDQLPVVLGQPVKAGERLVRLDAPEIQARLDQAQASLQQAASDWQRTSKLFEQQAATRVEFEAAQARYSIAQGAVAEATAMMDYVEIAAPFDGVVTRKWVDVGDLAAPGKPLIAIEDPSALQLEADVPQTIAAQVQRGARLVVQVDALDGDLLGTVNEIAPAADAASRTFRIKVDLPEQAGLRSGQFARLLVPVGESDALRVPVSAIVQRGQLEIAFVVTDRQAHLHLVKTGQRIGDDIDVLSGLHAGDAVVVEGAAQLSDGQPVEVK